MGADFCGARVMADLEGEVRQRFLNCPFQIVAAISLVKPDVVGAAERLLGQTRRYAPQ
jgi:hypothetical protein